jgi:hypothetical protein
MPFNFSSKTVQAVSTAEARKVSLQKIRDTIGKINATIVTTALTSGDRIEVVIPMGKEALKLRETLSHFYEAEGWYTDVRRRQVATSPKRQYRLCFILSTRPIRIRAGKQKQTQYSPQ